MGLFCLATKNTIVDDVESAICNLQLFLDNNHPDYLLDFALFNIKNAKEKMEAQEKY
jgi:hypothetical protein